MSANTFKVAGVSKFKDGYKVRFANELTRVKILAKNGHTEIELVELPSAMEKPAVVTFLKQSELMQNEACKAAIEEADAKYNGTPTVKVKAEKPAKASKKVAAPVETAEAETAE